jgi:uncharacterized membrane protein
MIYLQKKEEQEAIRAARKRKGETTQEELKRKD